MSNSKILKPKKNQFVAKFDLKKAVQEEFYLDKINEKELAWCMLVFGGSDIYTATRDVYPELESVESKRKARKLFRSTKMRSLLRAIKSQYVDTVAINANTLLQRLEIMYADAVEEGNSVLQLQIIKEMGAIMKTTLSLDVDQVVQFVLPNQINKSTDNRKAGIRYTHIGVEKLKEDEFKSINEPAIILPEGIEFEESEEL